MPKKDVVLVLAANVRRLMEAREDSQASLAGRAGLSQRAIGDLLTYGSSHFKNPTARTMEGIGKAFDVAPWLLLVPNLSLDLLTGNRLERLISNYRDVAPEGREVIDRVAESEVRYTGIAKTPQKPMFSRS